MSMSYVNEKFHNECHIRFIRFWNTHIYKTKLHTLYPIRPSSNLQTSNNTCRKGIQARRISHQSKTTDTISSYKTQVSTKIETCLPGEELPQQCPMSLKKGSPRTSTMPANPERQTPGGGTPSGSAQEDPLDRWASVNIVLVSFNKNCVSFLLPLFHIF